MQSFPRGQTLGLIIQSGYNFSIISTLFLKVAILSHFRDQKKYFSQAVRNTLRRSVKIQSALFKKYCRSYLCLWEVPPPHYIDRAIDAVTVSVDSCSAHRVRPNSPVISGTHIRNTFVLSNITQLNGAHPISERKENKKKSKKSIF